MNLDDFATEGFKATRLFVMIGLYVASSVASSRGDFQQSLILFGIGAILCGQALDEASRP